MMRHFKLPLIVSGIALSLAFVLGLSFVLWLSQTDISNRQKAKRASMLGTGLATATLVVIAPFWFVAAAKVGKEKRLRQTERSKSQTIR